MSRESLSSSQAREALGRGERLVDRDALSTTQESLHSVARQTPAHGKRCDLEYEFQHEFASGGKTRMLLRPARPKDLCVGLSDDLGDWSSYCTSNPSGSAFES